MSRHSALSISSPYLLSPAADGDLLLSCGPAPNGGPLPASTFYEQLTLVRRRAGIRPVTFHALRHTAATLAIEGGQPLPAVARMLGHSTVEPPP